MTRARKWVSCACGHNWTWQRQVESGEDTHCAVCGRNWRKQLSKQQASKEGSSERSPRTVWAAHGGQSKGKGKGKGQKGQPGPSGGKVGAVLAGLWKDLPESAQKAFQEVGYSPPRPRGPPPPPPGLDLQTLPLRARKSSTLQGPSSTQGQERMSKLFWRPRGSRPHRTKTLIPRSFRRRRS